MRSKKKGWTGGVICAPHALALLAAPLGESPLDLVVLGVVERVLVLLATTLAAALRLRRRVLLALLALAS